MPNSNTTADNYFDARRDCGRHCRIARGQTGPGERHDPRCAAVQDLGPAEHARIAKAAERIAR
jgi:hypothetical protein